MQWWALAVSLTTLTAASLLHLLASIASALRSPVTDGARFFGDGMLEVGGGGASCSCVFIRCGAVRSNGWYCAY